VPKDQKDQADRPETSKYAVTRRTHSLEATHARHAPKVYGCSKCCPPDGYPAGYLEA